MSVHDDYIARVLARPAQTAPHLTPYGIDCADGCRQPVFQVPGGEWVCLGKDDTRHVWRRLDGGWELLSTQTYDKEIRAWR